MHLQRLAPDQLVQQVAPFALQQVVPFSRTQTTTDRQTSLLAGSDRHVLGVLREACPRVRCHRTLRPRGTLAWRAAGEERGEEGRGGEGGGQRLCVGLDVSLLEVVGVGLITCEGEGVDLVIQSPNIPQCFIIGIN